MPLLKKKPFPLLSPPECDLERKESRDRQVWVSSITGEIFTMYSDYLERTILYKRPIWQCEMTGRVGLTFAEALESERIEKGRVKDKLPEELQKRVLERAQFQTTRLDNVVDDVYDYYIERFDTGDLVTCRWSDGVKYNARVLKVIPKDEDDMGEVSDELVKALKKADEAAIEHPRFFVELVDDDLSGLPEYKEIVNKKDIKRDRLQFSKNLLKKFLRDCLTRESYAGSPYTVKKPIADKYGIDTTLPTDLQNIKNRVEAKRRPAVSDGRKSKISDARKIESSLRYPIEDLDLPLYRRQPTGEGPIIDMAPGKRHANSTVPNPTGGMPTYPDSKTLESIPAECISPFLMVYSFLMVFARKLGLYPFSLDDFENALRHSSRDIKSQILIESNVCLLNAIINERRKPRGSSTQSGVSGASTGTSFGTYITRPSTPTPSLSRSHSSEDDVPESQSPANAESRDKEDEEDARKVPVGITWGRPEIYQVGSGWDARAIPVGDDREGWEDVLIGCIHDIAPPELGADIDRIFMQLVPKSGTTLGDREEAYLHLSLKDKVLLMELLVNVVNECSFIREYMDICQEQMTELRKQKIEIGRERKRINAERQELERRIEEEDGNGNGPSTNGTNKEDGSDDGESEEASIASTDRADTPFSDEGSTPPIQETRQLSRQAILKRKQLEREEREAKRVKLLHQQREQARMRSKELKARNTIRRQLDEDERQLLKKEEQVEQNMRKYDILRMKPLGRDKFFNRYFYLDNIGGANAHGTGRLFVQSPTSTDITVLRSRDDPLDATDEKENTNKPAGHGGGLHFVGQLMRAQGLDKEADFLESRIKDMSGLNNTDAATTNNYSEWWKCFDDPEDIEKLLAWLNPKGVREHKLRKEIEKNMHAMVNGMKKRSSEQNAPKLQVPTMRSTRSRSSPAVPPGSWLAYVNKFQK